MKDQKAWDWLGRSQLGYDIWEHKYRHNKESFDQWLDRITNGKDEYKKLITEKKFLPAGRILSNRGLHNEGINVTYSNCYVIKPPEDSIESIFDAAKEMARTFSYGGGVGIDISKLAPRGAKVNNTAKETSGAVSFMELYSMVTGLIGQSGRRGALMISLDCHHPDLEEFIDIKKDLSKVTQANISVKITDDFMQAVKNDEEFDLTFTRESTGETIRKTVKAKEIFHKLCEANWDNAEPGMLFWDRIENWSLLSEDKNFHYAGVNPCFSGDMKLLTVDGYKKFSDLCDTEPYIYNVNGNIVKSKVWCSGEKETVKVKIGENEIVCTPDHIFMTIDGNECRAKDLKGKYLMPYEKEQFGWVTMPKLKETCEVIKAWGFEYETCAFAWVKQISQTYVSDVIPNGKMKVYDFTEPERHWGIVEGYVVHNCAEEPLPQNGSCLLGSINLSEFVEHSFTERAHVNTVELFSTVKKAVYYLNEILDEGLPLHPLEGQRNTVQDYRQIGLGIMGLADMLIKLRETYGSEDAVETCKMVAQIIQQAALLASAELAKLHGTYPKYTPDILNSPFFKNAHFGTGQIEAERNGLRNSQLLTIAPTGTISTMLGISGGIEPIFAKSYTRKTESLKGHDEYYKVYTPIVEHYMKQNNLKDEEELPDFIITSSEIDYKNRIDMQGAFQDYIDASISSTINVPNEFTVEQIEDLYMRAWERGLKGVTIYRAGCQREGILVEEKPKQSNEIIVPRNDTQLPRGVITDVSDDLVGYKRKLTTGCGTIHLEEYIDELTNEPQETFINIGSSGGCERNYQFISRLISLCLRGGIPIEAIIEQGQSIRACTACIARMKTKGDVSKGTSCPSIITYGLQELYDKAKELLVDDEGDIAEEAIVEEEIIDVTEEAVCPECGATLVHEGGCDCCKHCGYSHCG